MTRDKKKYNNHPTGVIFTGQPMGGFFMGSGGIETRQCRAGYATPKQMRRMPGIDGTTQSSDRAGIESCLPTLKLTAPAVHSVGASILGVG